MVASYGGKDKMFARQGERLEAMLTHMGIDHDVKIYPDAGHSFMSNVPGLLPKLAAYGPMKVGYNAADAEDSWKRVDAFFAKHLGR